MRGHERAARATLIAVAVAGLAGCAGMVPPAPSWLPSRKQVSASPFGAFAALRVHDSARNARVVMGELIAVESDSTYLLPEDPSVGLVAIANEHIVRFGIRVHQPRGGARVAAESQLTRGVGRAALERMRPWARFPQGLPPHLDRGSLRLPQVQQGSD
jgi:hypothetical protein